MNAAKVFPRCTLRGDGSAHEFTAKLRSCVHRISPRLFQRGRLKKSPVRKLGFGVALLVTAVFAAVAAADESKPNNNAVIHPNLLINRAEIEQIKRKVQ